MGLSDFVSDNDIITQLRLQFDESEMWDIDFNTVLGLIIDRGMDLFLEYRNRKFSIDKITGTVTEVK